jgi:hypothetical protein
MARPQRPNIPAPSPTRPRRRAALLALAALALLGGCAQRRLVITSEPSGALVRLNDSEVGLTPCEVDFTYFGTYDVRLSKPGYEPLITSATAEAPLHEWPIIDLAAAAIPGKKETIIPWHFVLEPSVQDTPALIERAQSLRTQAMQAEPSEAGEAPSEPAAPEATAAP